VIPDSPYKGLVPFEDSQLDALLFFGRERESNIIGENVLAARLTVLYGPSGVGKTSVLRAGVAHRLRARAGRNVEERGHPEYAVVVLDAWSEDPVGSLRSAVREELAAQFGSALLDEREGESLAETFGRWTDALACDLLLILDQAEEYFLYHPGEGGFAAELPELVTRPGLRVRVLLSLRDDALSKLDRFKGRIPNLFANYLRLDHLDPRAARDAVEKPVERYNELADASIEIDPELTQMVLEQTVAGQVDLGEAGRGLAADDVSTGRIEAPYLQLVLERIWEEEQAAGSSRLRAETLLALGGAESIVRAHLRRAVEELSSEERDVAADVFRFLVTPSGTKIAHGVGDLAEYASVEEQRLLPVLSTLGRERIVRTVNGAGEDAARYEIFHDVLGEAVLAWRRERELERERRAAERRHRRLAMVAIVALIALAAMTAVAIFALSQRREARAAARTSKARELAATARAELIQDPLASLAVAVRSARTEPIPESESILRDSLLFSHVRRILYAGKGTVTAAAYDPSSTRIVTANGDGTARIFSADTGKRVALLRHSGGVTDAEFSPDGKTVATACGDGTVRLWRRDGRRIRALQHDAPVRDLEFSPDGRVLMSTTARGTAYIWRLTDGYSHSVLSGPVPAVKQPKRQSDASPLPQYQAPPLGRRQRRGGSGGMPESRTAPGVEISNDGQFAVVFGTDRFARVYSVATGVELLSLDNHSRVLSAAFGLRKEMLVTGGADWTAQTWDLRRGTPAYRLAAHRGHVVDVEVSPKGQFVGTASNDGTARIWDIATKRGDTASVLMGHTNYLTSIAFSPRGLYALTASRDGTARVWTTDRGNTVAVLAGHHGAVGGAVFDRTGRHVLTYGEDGTARIWDSHITAELRLIENEKVPLTGLAVADKGALRLTTDARGMAHIWRQGRRRLTLPVRQVSDATFSPDGTLAVTASGDGTVRIWSTDGAPQRTLRHTSPVAVAFDPEGRRLAAAGGQRVAIWDAATWRPARPVRTGPGVVDVSFSPDGKRLVTANVDGTASIWNVATGQRELEPLNGHRAALTSAAFSPDGSLVVTASADHDARVWNARTGELKHRLTIHGAIVSDAEFSPDGRWIVTAGPGLAGLWEVRTGRLLTLLRGHVDPIRTAVFGGPKFAIYTASEDGTVRKYTCEVCAPAPKLLELAERRLQRARRR
jgi:WD40 repeat protein